jgi:DNA-binding PadR family transcriptional regulator
VSKKDPTPIRDKRSRLDLELFVLALIKRNVVTPYQLQAEVGLSPGATLPVLARLEQSGYVRRGKPGPRGRTEYEITAGGHRFLKGGWRPLLASPPPADVEAILRIASLAILSGAKQITVADYLRKSAHAKAEDSKLRKNDIEGAAAELADTSDGRLYNWMRRTHSAARLRTDAKVLRNLAAQLRKLKLSS